MSSSVVAACWHGCRPAAPPVICARHGSRPAGPGRVGADRRKRLRAGAPMSQHLLTILTAIPVSRRGACPACRQPRAPHRMLSARWSSLILTLAIWHGIGSDGAMHFVERSRLGSRPRHRVSSWRRRPRRADAAALSHRYAHGGRGFDPQSRHPARPLLRPHAAVAESGLFGTFTALNFFHWFIFWELSLIPAFFLIKLWGGPKRGPAATQFFVYTMVGSVALLLAFLALFLATGTMDFETLTHMASTGALVPTRFKPTSAPSRCGSR